MSINWWCSNEIIGNGTTQDWCCFANRTCAEYVCGNLGSTIEIGRQGNDPIMYNCLTNATSAIELYSNPPSNGTCSNDAGAAGKGCLFNAANTPNSTSSTITSSTSTSPSSSSPASTSATSGGANSAGYQEITMLGQSAFLGLVGMVWLLKKLY